jgi:ribosomal protein L11 methylase PrmA
LNDNEDEVIETAKATGLNHIETIHDEEWISIVFRAVK